MEVLDVAQLNLHAYAKNIYTHLSLERIFAALYKTGSSDVRTMCRHLSAWTHNSAIGEHSLSGRDYWSAFHCLEVFKELSSMIDMWKNDATNNAEKMDLVDAFLLGLSAGLLHGHASEQFIHAQRLRSRHSPNISAPHWKHQTTKQATKAYNKHQDIAGAPPKHEPNTT